MSPDEPLAELDEDVLFVTDVMSAATMTDDDWMCCPTCGSHAPIEDIRANPETFLGECPRCRETEAAQ